MAQPPSAPVPPGAPPPPGLPVPPPYPYYTPPPPKQTSTVLIVVVIVVVLAVVITIVVAAVLFALVGGLVGGPDVNTPPVIAFPPASLTDGNATLTVAGVSREASIGLFTFRLEVNSARSAPSPFAGSEAPQLVSVAATSYQVTWNDTDSDGSLSLTDTVLVSGDGVPLGAGSYAFHLTWIPTGTEITARSWTV